MINTWYIFSVCSIHWQQIVHNPKGIVQENDDTESDHVLVRYEAEMTIVVVFIGTFRLEK